MSLLIDLVKEMKGKPTDKVSVGLYNNRTSICNACPNRLATGNCKLCFCFTNDKAKYVGENCPIKKW